MGVINFSIDNFIRNSVVTSVSVFFSIFVIMFVMFILITKQQQEESEKALNEKDRKHNERMQEIHDFYGQNQMGIMMQIEKIVKILADGKNLDNFDVGDPNKIYTENRKGLPLISPIKKEGEKNDER